MAPPLQKFWARVADGIAVHQLWAQFRADAREGFALYAKDVDWDAMRGRSRWHWFWHVSRALFWAMVMKLSPPRRVLFVISLALLVFPRFAYSFDSGNEVNVNLSLLGAAGLVVLLALELADRVTMKRDLEIAREIQSWLMPAAPPAVPGLDIAFATRPANTVAGDYYDAFFRPAAAGGRLLVVVADVAGKSMPAALLMATLQASLRTLASLPSSLLELVEGLNRYVCAQNPVGHRFTTAFIAELDPASGVLTYVNAGHNWPALSRASGPIERLETGGLPLGIMPAARYQMGSAHIGQGDVLLIFTDGLIEAEDDAQREYGEPRLMELLVRVGAESARETLRRIIGSVEEFAGAARQHDDITCLVLRRSAR
ncbi:MAG TPA: PP2C family protein-serine/threonine phosphatase [Bryobacteraceae bacterium]